MGVVAMVDGRVSFDLVETERLPETIGESDCGVAHGVPRATTGSSGRDDLNAIQSVLAANGAAGGLSKKLPEGPI